MNRDQRVVAGDLTAGRDLAELRPHLGAASVGAPTARAEAAAGRRRQRRRRLADRHAARRPDLRVGHRDRFEQKCGVGMRRGAVERLGRADLA